MSAGRPHTPAPARAVVTTLALTSGVAQGFGRFTYALLLPAVNAQLLHSYAVAGLLGTVNLAAYLAGTLAVSLSTSRFHPADVVRAGVLLVTAGLTVLAAAPDEAVLFVGMAVAGFGGALTWVPAPGIAGATVEVRRRGVAIGLIGAGIGIAVVASSALTAVMHALLGGGAWRAVWGVDAAVGLVAYLVAVRRLHPPPLPPAVRLEVTALRRVPGWLGATVCYAGYGLATSIYMSLVVAALEHDGGFSAAHASAVFAVVGVANVAGGVLFGRVSDAVGRRGALVGSYALMTAAVALVPVGAEPWAVLSALAFGLPSAGAPTVLAAHLADHLDARGVAAAFGAITLFFGLGQIAGPQLGGWIADTTGSFLGAFVVSAAAAALAGLASSTIPPRALPAPAATA